VTEQDYASAAAELSRAARSAWKELRAGKTYPDADAEARAAVTFLRGFISGASWVGTEEGRAWLEAFTREPADRC
jgi:hypothetical protein